MYCTRCGSRLAREKHRTDRFDAEFGWPVYRDRHVCPKRTHPLDGHTQTGWFYFRVKPDAWLDPEHER